MAITSLNKIDTEQLEQFFEAVNKEVEKGEEKRLAIVNVLRKYIKESKDVRFEGDGYSEEWVTEAAKRSEERRVGKEGSDRGLTRDIKQEKMKDESYTKLINYE